MQTPGDGLGRIEADVRPEEPPAARRVAEWYRGTVICRDVPGAPRGTVDFDIELQGGELIALEVTTYAVEEERAMDAAATKHPVKADGLGKSWLVILVAGVAQKNFGSRVAPLLMQMEEQGKGIFWGLSLTRDDDATDPPKVEVLLVREGVVSAISSSPGPEGPVISRAWIPADSDTAAFVAQAVPPRNTGLSLPAPSAGDIDQMKWKSILTAIEERGKAKAPQLRGSARERRELWIWCGTRSTQMALQSLTPPLEAPTLPPEITAVWVAVDTCLGIYSWRYAPTEGWTIAPESGQPALVGPPGVLSSLERQQNPTVKSLT